MQGQSWKIPEDADFPVREKKFSSSDRLLPLPVGVSGYIETVTGYYYVDKTLFIKSFVDTRPKVSLFTRPRRFGKTMTIDMLKVFFEKSPDDTSVYFKDKAIWKCGDNYRNMQGKYPVIFLSFKDVKYSEWKQVFKDLAENIRAEYARHSLLMESAQCSSFDTSGEAFYQGLMLGFCAVLNNRYAVKSSRESGAGRFDIGLFPLSADLPGFIFELKYTKNEKEDLAKLAENALCQIRRKQYQTEMTLTGIHLILSIGIAFCGKRAVIRAEPDGKSEN